MDLENSSNFSVESSRSIVSAIHVNQVGEVAAGGGNQGISLAAILGRVVYQPVLVVFGPAHIPSGPGSSLVVEATSMSSAVITPVADEDLRHNPPSFGNDYGTACVSRIVRSAWGSGKN